MILLHVTTLSTHILIKKEKEITTMHVRETASPRVGMILSGREASPSSDEPKKHSCGWLLLDSSRVFFHLAKYYLVSGWRWGRMQQARIDSINESSSWTSFTIYLVSFSVFVLLFKTHTYHQKKVSSYVVFIQNKKEKDTLSTSTPLPPKKLTKKGQREG